MRMAGKVALVSGAARGIGLAIVRAFSAEGATVYLTDVRLDDCRRAAEALGGGVLSAELDVRSEAAWIAAIDRVLAEQGRLDVLVNNAGVTGSGLGARPQDPEHATLEDWRSVHAVNLDGVFLGCKHAIRAMRSAGAGSIINMSSRSGLVGVPGLAAYASSKAAVRNHTKTVALWCAGQGLAIRRNSIHPAAILTPMWEQMLGDGAGRVAKEAALLKAAPLHRFDDRRRSPPWPCSWRRTKRLT